METTMKCPVCGFEVTEGEAECSRCGFPLLVQLGDSEEAARQLKQMADQYRKQACGRYEIGGAAGKPKDEGGSRPSSREGGSAQSGSAQAGNGSRAQSGSAQEGSGSRTQSEAARPGSGSSAQSGSAQAGSGSSAQPGSSHAGIGQTAQSSYETAGSGSRNAAGQKKKG